MLVAISYRIFKGQVAMGTKCTFRILINLTNSRMSILEFQSNKLHLSIKAMNS